MFTMYVHSKVYGILWDSYISQINNCIFYVFVDHILLEANATNQRNDLL